MYVEKENLMNLIYRLLYVYVAAFLSIPVQNVGLTTSIFKKLLNIHIKRDDDVCENK